MKTLTEIRIQSLHRSLNTLLTLTCTGFLVAGSIKTADCSVIDLYSLGGEESVAEFALNGLVVGEFQPVGEHYAHAFLYKDGVFKDINAAISRQSWANGVNSSGTVCGTYEDAETTRTHAFIYENGNFITLPDSIGGTGAAAINDLGQVVGVTHASLTRWGFPFQRAFIYTDGAMHDLNDYLPPNSGWELQDAQTIDNQGNITGFGKLNGFNGQFMLSIK